MAVQLECDKYTIAWFAILPIEAEAALAVLDQQHDGYFETTRADDYDYIGGEINGHNVVIATLPVGQNYGVGAAAALANQVKIRFPNIWFALLVGVAAGLPNLTPVDSTKRRDIRLGDVLVSVPDKTCPGVVHYDLGRDVDGDFRIVSRQAESPAKVRAAIGRIRLIHDRSYRRGSFLANLLQQLQKQKREQGKHDFDCPNQEEDELFSLPSTHASETTVAARPLRNEQERTQVWYGAIGSGNVLMRNPKRRDELRDLYDLIGLEMEAAGLMNTLPTGVIRGVCDYGDGFKSKRWQPYAAAVAAVYAKGLLCTMRPKIDSPRTVTAVAPNKTRGEQRYTEAIDRDVLSSLAFPEMRARRDNLQLHHHGTCRWILDLPKYQTWDASQQGLLWIKGKPGSGKSTMMSFLYTHIVSNSINEDILRLEFFFNARGVQLQHSFLGMIRSLLSQLVYHEPAARSLMRKHYEEKCAVFGDSRAWQWQEEELKSLLRQAIIDAARIRQILIFVDALDESGERFASEIADYFHNINDHVVETCGAVKICISCRHYPIVSDSCASEIVMERHNDHDIQVFVNNSLSVIGSSWEDSERWQQLKIAIIEQANGVFQWVRAVMPIIKKSVRDGLSLGATLTRLGKVPTDISQVYAYILQKVVSPEYLSQSLLLFQWVYLAEEPLLVTELRYALASSKLKPRPPPSPNIKCHDLPDFVETDEAMMSQIMAISGGLTEIVHGCVQVIHLTVNEFLAEQGLAMLGSLVRQQAETDEQLVSWISEVDKSSAAIINWCHGQLYWSCLKFIATEMITPSFPLPTTAYQYPDHFSRVSEASPFIMYAVENVFVHGRKANQCLPQDTLEQVRLLDQISAFWNMMALHLPFSKIFTEDEIFALHLAADADLANFAPSEASALYLAAGVNPANFDPSKTLAEDDSSALHLAAGANLAKVVEHKLTVDRSCVNARNKSLSTPLHFAAEHGNYKTVEILRRAEADLSARRNDGSTPLSLAARNGHLSVVKYLLDATIGSEDRTRDVGFALIEACAKGLSDVAWALLMADADVNYRDNEGRTPLMAASANGHGGLVRLLLDRDANIDTCAKGSGTALTLALKNGKQRVAQLLVDRGAGVNVREGTHDYALALTSALDRNYEQIVQTLLDRCVNWNLRSDESGTALVAAAERGREEIMRMLIDQGADVNGRNGNHHNALILASHTGREHSVWMLIDRGADVNAQDEVYGNALTAASVEGHERIVRMLVDNGADVNTQGHFYHDALLAASSRGHERIAQMLIDNGADVNTQGNIYSNALLAASSRGHERIVRMLIDNGADVNTQGNICGSALVAASADGHERIVRMLIDSGADVNIQDNAYGSALIAASARGYEQIVQILLDKGANIDAPGHCCANALEAARRYQHHHIVHLLLSGGASISTVDGTGIAKP